MTDIKVSTHPTRVKPMRITIVTGPFLPLPPAGCGAVERRWHEVARRFAALGHDVTFLSRAHASQAPDERIDGINHVRRGGYARTQSLKWDLLKDMVYSMRMARLLPAADILVTNVFWLPVLAARFRRDAGKIVVNVARVPKGQMRLYKRAARLSAVSQAIREAILAELPGAAPVTRVIPNPINTEVFLPPARPRERSGVQTILYTGRIHPEKGLHLLIEAFGRLFARNTAIRLRIVGPWRVNEGGGGEAYLDSLGAIAGSLPVDFREPVHDVRKLAAELQAAHVYCYPSVAEKGESFGVAPLEAMATGLVPVVSDLACFREFLEDGSTALVFDHRNSSAVQSLAEALDKILSDSKRAEKMGSAAARRARDFSYDNIAKMYLDDFREILDQR